ncbi:MAG: class II aldolase/adducin family protein [Thermoplasmatota archaeon]
MFPGLDTAQSKDLRSLKKVAKELKSCGWAKDTTGNFSLIKKYRVRKEPEIINEFKIDGDFPELAGYFIWLTPAGTEIEKVRDDPENGIGLYRILDGGSKLGLIWGAQPPTSEVLTHLSIARTRGKTPLSIIHCHMDRVIKLEERFGKEIRMSLPSWVGWVHSLPPGSRDLARTAAKRAEKFDIMIWESHGICAVGSEPVDALEIVQKLGEWAAEMGGD